MVTAKEVFELIVSVCRCQIVSRELAEAICRDKGDQKLSLLDGFHDELELFQNGFEIRERYREFRSDHRNFIIERKA